MTKQEINDKAEGGKENLETVQESIEEAAGKVAHTTNVDRDNAVAQTLGNVRIREEAGAGCTKVIKRKVLKENKQ